MEKVSVVMCTYNGAKYIREQLDSIVNQTYPLYEIIIQDDGSTDDTIKIIEEYLVKYPYIRLNINKEKKGINGNFFSAMLLAKGEYIAISDQDDIWELDKIETQLNSIGENWLSSGFSRPFATGENIKVHFDSRIPNFTIERMMYVGMTPGHTLLIKRSLLDKIPNLDKWMNYYTYDKLIQIVAAAYEKVQFCDKVLVNNRRHILAATYCPAQNYNKTLLNIFYSIRRTFLFYVELYPIIREYFTTLSIFLNEIETDTKSLRNAKALAKYHSKSSILYFVLLQIKCVKLRNRIFHTVEKNVFLSVMRALFFPISCSDYFRYMSKNYRK